MILNVLYYNASQNNISSLGWLFVRKKRRLHNQIAPLPDLSTSTTIEVLARFRRRHLGYGLSGSSPCSIFSKIGPKADHISARDSWNKSIYIECVQAGGSMTINWVLHTKKNTLEQYRKNIFFTGLIPFYYLSCLLCQETCHCHVFNNTDISRILSGWKVNSFHTW